MVDFRTAFERFASGLKAALFPAQSHRSAESSLGRRTSRSDRNTTKLFVGNLAYAMNDDSLRTLFERHGEVVRAEIVTDRETNASRGFGFIEMPSTEEARIAMNATNGREFDGRAIIVDLAKSRQRHNADSGSRATSSRGNRSRRGRSSSRSTRRPDRRSRETERTR